jgi:predicted sugar kinase
VADLVTLQPEALRRLLTSFYDTGVADDSLFTYHPVDFHVGLGYPEQAKLGLAAIVLVFVIVVALVWFVARLVRRRRVSQVSS